MEEVTPMDTIIISVDYYNTATKQKIFIQDIENEIEYLFYNNGSNFQLREYLAKNDIRWDYINSVFTNNLHHRIKFIGLSRIDGSMMFVVDKNFVPIELSITDLFGTLNLSYNTIRKNLTFKDFIRKEKISKLLDNSKLDDSLKYTINYEPKVRLIGCIEDHIPKIKK